MAAKWVLFGNANFESGFAETEDLNDTIDAMITVVENGY